MCLFSTPKAPKAPDPVVLPPPLPLPEINTQLAPDKAQTKLKQAAAASTTGTMTGKTGLAIFRNDLTSPTNMKFGSGLNIPT